MNITTLINTLERILVFTLIMSALQSGNTQVSNESNCSFDHIQKEKMAHDQGYAKRHDQLEGRIYRYLTNPQKIQKRASDYVLPVVIHIIHNGGTENISDADVLKGLDNLNRGFANIGYYDKNTGVDTRIQFCLAKQDPDGRLTTGINRVQSNLTNLNYTIDDQRMKDLSRWDPNNYVNIWLVKEICNSNGCGVVGYAYLPSAHGKTYDGLVCEANYFAGTEDKAILQVHELGHYLGLYHTFQGGCRNDDCLIDGDKICDTPPDNKVFDGTCMSGFNSCNTDANSGFATDQMDMNWNYMDYNTFSCYSAFTPNQAERMQYIIENVRKSLLESKGCRTPCPVQITAFFDLPDTIYIGDEIEFKSQSNNANTYDWTIDGISTSTLDLFKYIFLSKGLKSINLKVGNGNPDCIDYYSKDVVILCKAEAFFTPGTLDIETGQSVVFNNASINGNTSNWYVDGRWVSNNWDLTYSFNEPRTYKIELITSDLKGLCYDTTELCIDVACSVDCSFDTDKLFPFVGTEINFTNKSQKATSYVWTIDDIVVSQTQHFRTKFDKYGQYTVCLTAFNQYCEKSYCVTIWVQDSLNTNCQQTFVKILGKSNSIDEGLSIEFLDDGSFIVSGSHDGKSAIYHMNKEGGFVENWDMRFTNNVEKLQHLIHTGNRIIISTGVGNKLNTNNRSAYFFKYDINNSQLLWEKEILFPSVNYPIIYKLIELPNGNIAGAGQVFSSNCDAIIFELDGITGNIVWQKTIFTHGCDTHFSFIYTGNAYYAVGRFSAGQSNSTGGFRPSVVKFDLLGNIIFQKFYLVNSNGSARLYNESICEDNGLLVSTIGVETGINLDNSKLYFSKLDYDGNIQWMKKYNFGRKYLHSKKVINIPDGYILYGHYIYDNSNRALYVIKTDKNGDIIWSKSIKVGPNNIQGDIVWHNGFYHIVATTNFYGDSDVLWMRIDQNGDLWPDCENYVQPLNVTVTSIANPFEGNMKTTVSTKSLPYKDVRVDQLINPAQDSALCFIDDCIDTCDIVSDASIQILDNKCLGNKLEVDLKICNYGSISLPQGTPIRIYSKNPTIYNTRFLDVIELPVKIDSGECYTITIVINANKNQDLYFTINDSGEESTPYNVNGILKPTYVVECNFINNLDSFQFVKPSSNLDLGPDSELCEHNIQIIHAGDGFVSYLWQDGSIESQFTAWEPGIYWVEVMDGCGFIYRDSIEIKIDKGSVIDIGNDTIICLGDSLFYNLKGYKNYKWIVNSYLPCDTCDKVVFTPTNSDTLIISAKNDKGCYVTDTIRIKVNIGHDRFDTLSICQGDTLIYHGETFQNEGDYLVTSTNNLECDSNFYLRINILSGYQQFDTVAICQGDSVDYHNNVFYKEGMYTVSIKENCDSIYHLVIRYLENNYYDYGILEICHGDSLNFGKSTIFRAGQYSDTINQINRCDSIITVELVVHPIFKNPIIGDSIYCEGDTAFIRATLGLHDIYWSTGETSDEIALVKSGIYLLNAMDENDCPIEARIQIRFNALPNIDLQFTHESCVGESDGSISISSFGGINFKYFLNGQKTDQKSISALDPGEYIIEVIDSLGCSSDKKIVINPGTDIDVNLGLDIEINNLDDEVIIKSLLSRGNAIKITWTIDDDPFGNGENSIMFQPSGNHVVRVFVEDKNGCLSEDELLIIFKVRNDIFVPNTFSPNGDGINDFFTVFARNGNIIIDKMEIYDRWGELIYKQFDLSTGISEPRFWDGTFNQKKLQPGVFVYFIEYHLVTGKPGTIKGPISLIR